MHPALTKTAHNAINLIVIEAFHPPNKQWLRRRLALLGAILAAQRIVKFGRKCGHFREQAYEPLAGPAAFAVIAHDFG